MLLLQAHQHLIEQLGHCRGHLLDAVVDLLEHAKDAQLLAGDHQEERLVSVGLLDHGAHLVVARELVEALAVVPERLTHQLLLLLLGQWREAELRNALEAQRVTRHVVVILSRYENARLRGERQPLETLRTVLPIHTPK